MYSDEDNGQAFVDEFSCSSVTKDTIRTRVPEYPSAQKRAALTMFFNDLGYEEIVTIMSSAGKIS